MNSTIIKKKFFLLLLIFAVAIPNKLCAQEFVVDLNEVRLLVDRWAEAHNDKDISTLRKMYSEEVIFYAETLPKAACMNIKTKSLRAARHFHLEVVDRPLVKVYSSQTIKVSFIKRVTANGSTKDYDAYLLLKQNDNHLLIAGESDLTTDNNLGYSLSLGKELKRVTLSEKSVPVEEADKSKQINDNVDQKNVSKPSAERGNSGWLIFMAISEITLIIGILLIIGFIVYKKLSAKQRTQSSDLIKPSLAEEIGLAFEKFIVNRFDTRYYKIIEWRSDKIIHGIFAQSSKYPDLEVEFTFGGESRIFAVECKYRRTLFNGRFQLDQKQFDNYTKFKKLKNMPVYIALGVGGEPEAPNDLYIVPLQCFDAYGNLHPETMLRFYDDPNRTFYFDLQKNTFRYFRKQS